MIKYFHLGACFLFKSVAGYEDCSSTTEKNLYVLHTPQRSSCVDCSLVLLNSDPVTAENKVLKLVKSKNEAML